VYSVNLGINAKTGSGNETKSKETKGRVTQLKTLVMIVGIISNGSGVMLSPRRS